MIQIIQIISFEFEITIVNNKDLQNNFFFLIIYI